MNEPIDYTPWQQFVMRTSFDRYGAFGPHTDIMAMLDLIDQLHDNRCNDRPGPAQQNLADLRTLIGDFTMNP